MADRTITEFPADTSISGTEEIPVWDTSVCKKITVDELVEYFSTVGLGSLQFEVLAGDPVSPVEGQVWWNATDKTLNVQLNGMTLQVGQEHVIRIVNKTGSQINNGTLVSVPESSSAVGDRPKGEPLDVTSLSSCRCFLGTATEDIANNAEGFVTRFGLVRGLQLGSYTAGDRLWGVGSAGAFTNVEPTSGRKVLAGMVLRANDGSGIMLSNPHSFELTAEMSNTLKEDGSIETPAITYTGPYYKDQIISLVGINPAGPATAPTLDPNGEGFLFGGGTTDNVAVLGVQINHDCLQGAVTIYPHVHWRKTTAAAGNVTWRLEAKSAAVGGDFGAFAQVGTDVSTPIGATIDNNTAERHLITSFGSLSLTVGLSTMLVFRLTRVASNTGTDTYNADVLAMSFDFHYPVDTPGSVSQYSKT